MTDVTDASAGVRALTEPAGRAGAGADEAGGTHDGGTDGRNGGGERGMTVTTNPTTTTGAATGRDRAPREADGTAATAQLAFVGAGPGDPDLLTVRATALLAAADVVAAEEHIAERLAKIVNPGAR